MKNITSLTFFSIIFSIFIGIIMGVFSPLYGLAILAFSIFISLTIANMRYGILSWIIAGGIFVIPIYTTRSAGIYLSVLMISILILLWIFIALATKKLFITQTKLFWPLIFLIVITILSYIKGNILYDPDVSGEHRFVLVQIFASFIIIISVVTAFMVPRFFETDKQIRPIYFALICVGVMVLIFEALGLSKLGFAPSWTPLMQAHAISLAYAGLLFMPELSLWKKIIFCLLIIFSIQYIVLQFLLGGEQWISGWIAIAIPLLYITFRKSKVWSIFLLVLFFVLVFILAGDQIKYMFIAAEEERDFDRFIMWLTAFKLWQKNPLFGVGAGNYMDYSITYAVKGFTYTSAHGQYFQILTELGGFGFVCFFWLITKIVLLGKYLINKVTDNFSKAFVIGVMGSIYGQLFASLLGDYILPSYHNGGVKNISTTIYFWILVGSLMAIEQIVRKNEVENTIRNGEMYQTLDSKA